MSWSVICHIFSKFCLFRWYSMGSHSGVMSNDSTFRIGIPARGSYLACKINDICPNVYSTQNVENTKNTRLLYAIHRIFPNMCRISAVREKNHQEYVQLKCIHIFTIKYGKSPCWREYGEKLRLYMYVFIFLCSSASNCYVCLL